MKAVKQNYEIRGSNDEKGTSLWSFRERKCLSLLQQKNSRASLLQIHGFMLKSSLETNVNLLTKFITTASTIAGIQYARQLFDNRPHRDDGFLCNAMIKCHADTHQFEESLALYRDLKRETSFTPDGYTFLNLSKSCSLNLAVWEGQEVHNQVVKSGFSSDLFVSTTLVDMYAKFRKMGCARKVFDEMNERSEVSWTALIGGYARCGDMGSAKELFDQMTEKDSAAYNMMIDAFVKLGDMDSARSLFDQMPERNVVSWTSMVDGYSNTGDVGSARLLFDAMPKKNLFSWNAMIGGYCQNKQPHEALKLFNELQRETSLEPDNVTIVSILPAVAVLGALDLGCWIHQFVRKKHMNRDVNVGTALVDMYAKCGEITKARTAFDCMSKKETATWNALINGLAVNSCAKEALEAFFDMKSEGFKPNEITMIGVLSACSHGGLVEEGWRWFKEMHKFRLTPTIEHYGCMVDLFGRAGHLEEAERLIESMPHEVNAIILSTFLFACIYAKDVARAERVLKKTSTTEPWNDGNYIMLRNLYAMERRWGDVKEIKGLMRKKGTNKEVGCSSIEVNSRVVEFVAGDRVHPQWVLTRAVLGQLQMHMKSHHLI